jgi:hypothetical protein
VASESARPGGPTPIRSGGHRGHRKLSLACLVLGTILAVVAVFSIWANRQALNTDNWVHTSGRILADKKVEERLSAYLANELLTHVDVKAELEKQLPTQLQALAGPAAAGLDQLAPQAAERLLASPRVEALWATANRAAHETLLKLLDGGSGAISTEGGEVSLDLGEVVREVAGQLGVGAGLAEKLPADAGKLTILRSDQISTAQSVAKLIRTLPIVLTLLVLILYGLAIWLAGPRRRQALRSAGLGFVIAGAAVLLLRTVAGHALVNSLVKVEANKPAVESVWSIATSLLATVAWSALAFGVLVFLAAWLAGPTRLAARARAEAAPYLRDQPVGVGIAAFLVWLALIAFVPIAAFGKPLGIVLFAVLYAAGVWLLWRQTQREFPSSGKSTPAEAAAGEHGGGAAT